MAIAQVRIAVSQFRGSANWEDSMLMAELAAAEGRYNSAVALDPDGNLVAKYRKLHRDGAEERWFKAGELLERLFRRARSR